MGNVKIRYYTTRQHPGRPKWGYWAPCLKRRNPKTGKIEPTLMAKLGFGLVECGEDGPRAWSIAQMWNARWDAALKEHRAGVSVNPRSIRRIYPPGSFGEAYERYRQTGAFRAKKPGTQASWASGWKHIEPVFGDVDPRTIGLEEVDLWYGGDAEGTIKGLIDTIGVGEAYRAVKIWRALWKQAASMNRPGGGKYCERDEDPSLGIRRKTPQARTAVWREGEAVRLVKRAWRMGRPGLACIMAVAWDTMLSPVDVRGLTRAQLRGDAEGPFFQVDRAKTGKGAIGTLSKRTRRLIEGYRAGLACEIIDNSPMFLTAGAAPGPKGGKRWLPQPYTKDNLTHHFRDVRDAEFPGDTRKLSDFRRSGAKEAELGGVTSSELGRKMANTIETDAKLRDTYLPPTKHDATLVRLADHARTRGRGKMRGGDQGG